MRRTIVLTITALGALLLTHTSVASPTHDAATPVCGASFLPEQQGESFQEAFERVNGYYDLESVRLFYSGLPKEWPGKLDAGNLPMTVSFKMAPQEVVDGQHDAHMRDWFAGAPKDRDIYWTFFHEPEDNVEQGEYTTEQFRAAWQHLAGLAKEAGNDRLHATLILMDWTVDPASGRQWTDYYPGDEYIDILGWDSYNQIGGETTEYRSPEDMFGELIRVSEQAGKPFAIAETGSDLATGDSGEQRAAWLREVVDYLTKHGALWVQYFDVDYTSHGHSDYRLRDEPSQSAWREFCNS
ncbi:glycosyl hydrolase family 26 [Tamaricihabitans halophyticus]|uniref:Glycosyl hydrolase family 26 n=1 Tax=Tamaricihabitans halophyticus TaxID=1262583 RepID=A0A4R2QZK6_9PSEU|nr:glycosyl hydrolase [Tamaricihabitans halophyticus]TCP54824.1 glycosyl hydrolase family 26 [Tamaricihabitans halophyticus]